MKKIIMLICLVVCLTGVIACQAYLHGEKAEDDAAAAARVIPKMESSNAPWAETVSKNCKIQDIGRPYGTVKETLKEQENSWQITFEIDETVSEELLKEYVKSIWASCEKANGGRLKNSTGKLYDSFEHAERAQDPLPYYIWYYSVEQVKYRVGIYPTNLERGFGGGIVMQIEKWNKLV